MGRRLELERYPLDQVTKWRRINNLIRNVEDILDIEEAILEGDEEAIRDYIKQGKTTRNELVRKAQIIGIKNYGRLTKKQLSDAIGITERNKGSR